MEETKSLVDQLEAIYVERFNSGIWNLNLHREIAIKSILRCQSDLVAALRSRLVFLEQLKQKGKFQVAAPIIINKTPVRIAHADIDFMILEIQGLLKIVDDYQ